MDGLGGAHGGDPEPARAWLRQGLNQALTDACGFHQWFGLLGLAQVAGLQGHHTEAATWYGAAERLAELGFDRSRFVGFSRRDVADVEAARAMTRTALGEEAFAAAFDTGKAISLEQIVAQLPATASLPSGDG